MAAGDIKNAYATRATLSFSIENVATGAAWQSAAIDNSANKYRDILIQVETTTGAAGSTGSLNFYAAAKMASGAYTDGASGSNATFTYANRVNSPFIGNVQMRTTNAVVGSPMSVAAAFGGTLPEFVSIIMANDSGGTTNSTAGNHVVTWQGIYQTVAQ